MKLCLKVSDLRPGETMSDVALDVRVMHAHLEQMLRGMAESLVADGHVPFMLTAELKVDAAVIHGREPVAVGMAGKGAPESAS